MKKAKAFVPSKQFGDYYWASGPLFIGSAALERLAQARDPGLLGDASLKRLADATAVRTVRGEQTLVFGKNVPSKWLQSERVLVRIHKHASHVHEKKVLSLDPAHVPPDAWKRAAFTLRLEGDAKRVFVDPWSQHPARAKVPAGTPVHLAAGAWEVDTATIGEEQFKVDLFRFRPKGEEPVALAPPKKAKPGPPSDLVLSAEVKKAGKTLRFVETEGGPVLAVPIALLPKWNGVCDAKGEVIYGEAPCDYDRACDTKKQVLKVGTGEALVLDQESTAFFARDADTAYLLTWIGADDGAHVLQAALSADANQWKDTKEHFTLKSKGGLALIDSAERGASVKKPVLAALAPGRWKLAQMKEFNGSIIDGKTKHGLMATALRLTRVK